MFTNFKVKAYGIIHESKDSMDGSDLTTSAKIISGKLINTFPLKIGNKSYKFATISKDSEIQICLATHRLTKIMSYKGQPKNEADSIKYLEDFISSKDVNVVTSMLNQEIVHSNMTKDDTPWITFAIYTNNRGKEVLVLKGRRHKGKFVYKGEGENSSRFKPASKQWGFGIEFDDLHTKMTRDAPTGMKFKEGIDVSTSSKNEVEKFILKYAK